jgi:hypothetical protein
LIKNGEIIKNVLLSVLSEGEKSHLVNELYRICVNFAIASLSAGKNRFFQYEIIQRAGGSLRDLATDCIADLFENRGGKYFHLNKYFDKYFPSGIDGVHPDKITASLATLIKSATSQRISELRQNFDEIFFDIKKSLETYIKRNSHLYEKYSINGNMYLQTKNSHKPDFTLPAIDKDLLVSKILELKLSKHNIAVLIPHVFLIMDAEEDICKTIKENYLIECLKDYYIIKINNSLENLICPYDVNVEYIDSSENLEDIESFTRETEEI